MDEIGRRASSLNSDACGIGKKRPVSNHERVRRRPDLKALCFASFRTPRTRMIDVQALLDSNVTLMAFYTFMVRFIVEKSSSTLHPGSRRFDKRPVSRTHANAPRFDAPRLTLSFF